MKRIACYDVITFVSFAAATVLLVASCDVIQAIPEAYSTPSPLTGEIPADAITEGVASVIANPADPVGWWRLLVGGVALGIGAFAIAKVRKAKSPVADVVASITGEVEPK